MPLKKNSIVKLGIMGGSFNPLHLGHINSLLTVKENFKLDKIILVPAFQPPLSQPLKEAQALERLEMVQEVSKSYPFLQVSDYEVTEKGISYSYKTLEHLTKQKKSKKFFFIMGLDQFHNFDRWKNFDSILKQVHLIVTSRPKTCFPKNSKEMPKKLQPLIKSWSSQKVTFKSPYKTLHFCSLNDMDISSSVIKKRLKNNQSIHHLVPIEVNHYINTHSLYQKKSKKKPAVDFKKLSRFCKKELENKKASQIEIFDLSSRSLPFSTGLIASCSNTRQSKSLARHLKKQVEKTFHIKPLGTEGEREGRWIVLDYNDFIVHIFYDYVRDFYKLDDIWQ